MMKIRNNIISGGQDRLKVKIKRQEVALRCRSVGLCRERERARAPVLDFSEPNRAEKSWLLFEGVDTFLYDLMRKSKTVL